MLFWIVLLVIILLAWFEIIPVRLWLAKTITKYYGKSARIKIKLIKIIEPLLNLFE